MKTKIEKESLRFSRKRKYGAPDRSSVVNDYVTTHRSRFDEVAYMFK